MHVMGNVCTEGRLLKRDKKKEKKNENEKKQKNVPRRADALLRCLWVTGDCLRVQFHPGSDPKVVAASYGFSPGRRKSWVEMVP